MFTDPGVNTGCGLWRLRLLLRQRLVQVLPGRLSFYEGWGSNKVLDSQADDSLSVKAKI